MIMTKMGNQPNTISIKYKNREIIKGIFNNNIIFNKRIYLIKNGQIQSGYQFDFSAYSIINGVWTITTPYIFSVGTDNYYGINNLNLNASSAQASGSVKTSLAFFIKSTTAFDTINYDISFNYYQYKSSSQGVAGNILLGTPGAGNQGYITNTVNFTFNSSTIPAYNPTDTFIIYGPKKENASYRGIEPNKNLIRIFIGAFPATTNVQISTILSLGIKDLWLEKK